MQTFHEKKNFLKTKGRFFSGSGHFKKVQTEMDHFFFLIKVITHNDYTLSEMITHNHYALSLITVLIA